MSNWCVLTLLLVVSTSSVGLSTDISKPYDGRRITLSVIDHPVIVDKFSPTVLAAYRQLGIKVKLELVTGGRGLIESSEGRTDGELVRAAVIEKYTDRLLRIPVSLGVIRAKLYCHQKVLCDLKVLDDPLTTVGVVTGNNAMTDLLEHRQATVITIPDLGNLQKMLEMGRFKYIIGFEHDAGFKFIYSERFQIAPGEFYEVDVFHYIHEKHRALLPTLTAAMQQSLLLHPIHGQDY